MKAAIREAKKGICARGVPIGCVIVQNDRIIARGYNRRNTEEIHWRTRSLPRSKGEQKTGDWRLEDCTMYVTLEPCQMCAGAIVQSRMKKVVIGSMNPKAGCAGSVLNLLQMAQFNHRSRSRGACWRRNVRRCSPASSGNCAIRKRACVKTCRMLDNRASDRIYLSLRAAGVVAVPCTNNPL